MNHPAREHAAPPDEQPGSPALSAADGGAAVLPKFPPSVPPSARQPSPGAAAGAGRCARIIYPLLPPMTACDGCGDCCGPVSVNEQEAEYITDFLRLSAVCWTSTDLLRCGFYDKQSRRCLIYDVRPFGCRLFGVVQEMPCPHYPMAAVASFPANRAVAEGYSNLSDMFLDELVERIGLNDA